ncbi:DUF2274 domain-containing protein [Alcaligenes faecalis]|uniref:DUF2274 domain-containing protein n=1 Tax=Alcaligenes faecalis TaxID=511 RepID=UPI00122CD7A0|nr:DUF2274 domain-containing protein [Alcaligenes faecalis]KAA1288956.1 DUF2274 domain-containing protein [Alcaligenes faecalis]MCM2558765.1 DUF2274 domain-containing protein [Alcaligenes faecalis]MCM2622643.1 DUF2274 domain-containing protein [Alcaligenes faecalis]MCR4142891.1 DUF2274 domain-containing protein [Alcaligenes faecalis]WHQ43801.1 DUF2274 domain-containing protein [Alcaligenes faecalis]
MATKLRLGPLPRRENVKITISISAQLRNELERYAAAHSQLYGEKVDAVALIPHMLERFVATDRGFRRDRRGT